MGKITKKLSNTITRKTSIQKGGLFKGDNKNAEKYFKDFISNSTFQFLSRGTFGLTFIATLKPGVESPYLHMDINNFNEPVNKILLKIAFIHKDDSRRYDNIELGFAINGSECISTHQDNFAKEVNIQTEIYFKTYRYLQAICPAVLFSSIESIQGDNIMEIMEEIDGQQIETKLSCNNLISLMINNAMDDNVIEYLLEIYKHFKDGFIGIIAMEYADGYEPLSRMRLVPGGYERSLIIKYMLITLLLETGYIHSDFNMNNILVNAKDQTFINDFPYRMLLIDFGFVIKINSKNLRYARELVKEKNYLAVITMICDSKTFGDDGLHALDIFKYICDPFYYHNIFSKIKQNVFLDTQIQLLDNIFHQREVSITENIEEYQRKNKTNPNKYPLLPLDNSFKKYLYNGLFLRNENTTKMSSMNSNSTPKPKYKTNKNKINNVSIMNNFNQLPKNY